MARIRVHAVAVSRDQITVRRTDNGQRWTYRDAILRFDTPRSGPCAPSVHVALGVSEGTLPTIVNPARSTPSAVRAPRVSLFEAAVRRAASDWLFDRIADTVA